MYSVFINRYKDEILEVKFLLKVINNICLIPFIATSLSKNKHIYVQVMHSLETKTMQVKYIARNANCMCAS